jgi:hypothetical protein
MTLSEYYKTIDLDEIDRYISEGQEENVNLEFKTVNHPDINSLSFDKKNISKTISGFANSNGGIIIWGIKAKNNSLNQDVAEEKKPIKELTKFLNLLNRLEGQAVIPTINGIIHEKIDLGGDTGFIKTFVPRSESAPHMAIFSDKHYYKRSGDSFYQCEHYDIVDMFSRKKSPKLKVTAKVIAKDKMHQVRFRYFVLLSISNEGHNIAKYPYLALNFSNGFWQASDYGLDGNRNCGLNRVKNNILYRHNYSGGIDIVIYPGAVLDVDKFYLEIPIEQSPSDVVIDYMVSAEDTESTIGQLKISGEELAAMLNIS